MKEGRLAGATGLRGCLAGLAESKAPPPTGNLGPTGWTGRPTLGRSTIELTGLAMPVPLAPAPLGWCLSLRSLPPLPRSGPGLA